MVNKQELLALIDKYLADEANKEEIDMLSRYYNSFQQNRYWNETELGPLADTEAALFRRIEDKIKLDPNKKIMAHPEVEAETGEQKVFPLRQKKKFFMFIKFAAAASVICLILIGTYFVVKKDLKNEVAKTTTKDKPFKNDVPPGGNKAVLTLADGSTIILDDAQNGDLTLQGNTKLIKLNGKLAYNPTKNIYGEIVYNTIATPRGGKYQVELPDGSQVWLNSASSLHFPIAFVGKVRKVEVTGEAYFEVAKNREMPFVVSVNGSEVEVLGTHFNIMAFKEEDAVKTTLLEGSVKFVNGNNSSLLRPGQQSQLLRNGQVKVISNVDVDNVISWKNGMFHFENADMEMVMRQLSRWYDVEVVFKSKKLQDPLHVEIPFNTNLSDALKILEEAGTARFEIKGKQIIVIQ